MQSTKQIYTGKEPHSFVRWYPLQLLNMFKTLYRICRTLTDMERIWRMITVYIPYIYRTLTDINGLGKKVSGFYPLAQSGDMWQGHKQSCVLTAFLLRPVRSYHVLTACPPRPLRVYGVSSEIYGLGNGDHGRSRGALTTILGFLPCILYVYRECTATSGRFYHVLTATMY